MRVLNCFPTDPTLALDEPEAVLVVRLVALAKLPDAGERHCE